MEYIRSSSRQTFERLSDGGICHQPQEQDNESRNYSQLRLQTFQVGQNPQRHDQHHSAESRDNDCDEAIDFPVREKLDLFSVVQR